MTVSGERGLKLVLSAMLCGSALVRSAAGASIKLDCSSTPHHGFKALKMESRYNPADRSSNFGFDLAAPPRITPSGCVSDTPFFFSIAEPEGNYRVTVTLGSREQDSITTVKAEARRLMLQEIPASRDKSVKRSFNVNVRTDVISADEKVKLKPREIGGLDWDGKLTLEFAGTHPSVRSIEIKPVRVATVYVAGDSTVVDQDKEPWAAWGQMLPRFFNDKVSVANEAESGETIQSFVGEKRFDKIMSTLTRGDSLFMQFAHNDQKPGRGFVPVPQYKDILRRYIALARDKGAHPVLVTSMNRRNFMPDGAIRQTLGEYPDAMRAVAQEQHVPLIDLNAMSKTLFETMGPKGTLNAFVHYPANTFPDQPQELKDDTHFNSYGALELAKCVVQAVRDLDLPLSRDIVRDTPSFDPSHPDLPTAWEVPVDPFLSAQTPYER